VSHPTARFVSHPAAHTNGVSGDEEPRYVSHPIAHTNAVFWRNTESNTDTHHADVQQSTHHVNVTVSDTSHAVTHGWRSKLVVALFVCSIVPNL
jgi:hypothetical protein